MVRAVCGFEHLPDHPPTVIGYHVNENTSDCLGSYYY